ncbi:MAG TPA: metal ABC transporter substrate-binding protein [Thermodesulfobacteriota bacterium]|nr:metal ABC transporter substrate-binding protein [Thermodesulfobacteriota bacterium]
MKSRLICLLSIILLIGVFCAGARPAHAAKIRIVATLTDLADLARNIGDDLVEVHSLATGVEDTHGVPMKPSFVPMMNQADLLLLVGFECEHAFLPGLLEASKNPRIQRDRAGYIDCSKGIIPRDVPKSTEHYAGDVHPYGNPHYMLDPVLAKTAIQNIYNALVEFAPQYQGEFTRNRDAYLAKLNAKIAEWEKEVKPLKGVKFVSYHEHWPYFADRFGLDYFGTIELRPGIDPTPRHIEELIAKMKVEHVPIVAREPQFPERVPKRIAEQTGATLITLPIMPGGVPNTETYIKMMDYIIHTMVGAVQSRK